MQWYIRVMKNYFGFQGRATREEYWYFTAFNILFYVAAIGFDTVTMMPVFSVFYSLAVLFPGIAVFFQENA